MEEPRVIAFPFERAFSIGEVLSFWGSIMWKIEEIGQRSLNSGQILLAYGGYLEFMGIVLRLILNRMKFLNAHNFSMPLSTGDLFAVVT